MYRSEEDAMATLQTQGYDRVRAHGSKRINARMDRLRETNLKRAEEEPRFAVERLAKLEREWDIDRTILLSFAGMGSAALLLGLRKNWRWRFPLTVQIGFLLTHAMIGWCPPAVVLRRLGFRTRQEIEAERMALMAIRGPDFGVSNA
jgi:hypothetical protein